jgi:hypothetical protein
MKSDGGVRRRGVIGGSGIVGEGRKGEVVGIDSKVGEIVVELLANSEINSECGASALYTARRGQLIPRSRERATKRTPKLARVTAR